VEHEEAQRVVELLFDELLALVWLLGLPGFGDVPELAEFDKGVLRFL
jgi:hypothetical protein